MKEQKSLKFSLIIITISIIALFALCVALPWLVTWFVETKHKDAGLPALIMLTCYPCMPFVAVALFNLRKLIKNCLNGMVFGDKNITSLKIVSVCCFCGAAITFVSGFFYLPFFALSIASAGCALIAKVIKDLFLAELNSRREDLLNSMRDEL